MLYFILSFTLVFTLFSPRNRVSFDRSIQNLQMSNTFPHRSTIHTVLHTDQSPSWYTPKPALLRFSKDISSNCALRQTSKKTVLKGNFTIGFYTPVGGKNVFSFIAAPTQANPIVAVEKSTRSRVV